MEGAAAEGSAIVSVQVVGDIHSPDSFGGDLIKGAEHTIYIIEHLYEIKGLKSSLKDVFSCTLTISAMRLIEQTSRRAFTPTTESV